MSFQLSVVEVPGHCQDLFLPRTTLAAPPSWSRICWTPRPSHSPMAPPEAARKEAKLKAGKSLMKVFTVVENAISNLL